MLERVSKSSSRSSFCLEEHLTPLVWLMLRYAELIWSYFGKICTKFNHIYNITVIKMRCNHLYIVSKEGLYNTYGSLRISHTVLFLLWITALLCSLKFKLVCKSTFWRGAWLIVFSSKLTVGNSGGICFVFCFVWKFKRKTNPWAFFLGSVLKFIFRWNAHSVIILKIEFIEAVVQRCSVKKVFLELSQNSHAWGLQLY